MLALILYFGLFIHQAVCELEYKGEPISCPMVGYEIRGYNNLKDATVIENVGNWKDCAYNCKQNADIDCYMWIYWHNDKADWYQQCRLYKLEKKADKVIKHRKGYSTMGKRDCQGSCEAITRENGEVTGTNEYKDVKTIQCNEGYSINGEESVECGVDDWPGSLGTCQGNPCEVITRENGVLHGTNKFGDGYALICNDGYFIDGVNHVECGVNGWSNTLATCSEICGNVQIENGEVNRDGDKLYRVGDKLDIKCVESYKFTENIICTENGWSSALRTCTREWCAQMYNKPVWYSIPVGAVCKKAKNNNCYDIDNKKTIPNDKIDEVKVARGCTLDVWDRDTYRKQIGKTMYGGDTGSGSITLENRDKMTSYKCNCS